MLARKEVDYVIDQFREQNRPVDWPTIVGLTLLIAIAVVCSVLIVLGID